NHGLVAGIEKAHGDHFHALRVDRNDLLAHGGERLFSGAEHDGDVWAVDVGIQQADLMAEFREGERESHGDGRLPDAAFAGGDGNEILDAGNGLRRGLLLWRWAWRHGLGLLRAHALAPWHFLYFLPEPQGQGSLRPTLAPARTGLGAS